MKKTIRKILKAFNYDLFQNQSSKTPVQMQPSFVSANLPKTEKSELPSVDDLYLMFDKINRHYFENKLPLVRIEYSNRMTNAGSYTPALKLIKMSRKYHEIFPDDIEDTLKHEMIHIIHFYHNAEFKKEAARIGTSLKAKSHPALRRKPKYIYLCPSCKKEYPRQKILRMASCGDCSAKGVFDNCFKLKLKKT